jgi:subtilisin family serine protease
MILLVFGIAGETYGIVPNDPIFPVQWHLQNTGQNGGVVGADIHATEAWDITTGSMSTVVALLDNGVLYDHEDLYLNIYLNQGEIPSALAASLTDTDSDGLITFRDLNHSSNQSFVSDNNSTGFIDAGDLLSDPSWENGDDQDGNGFVDDLVGWDFQGNDNDPRQGSLSHGTLMAGILGAITDNGVGVAGVNWKVQIMPLRQSTITGVTDINHNIASLNYAVENGASISSNSWAWREGDIPMDGAIDMYDAIKAAGENNHLFIAAAGNESADNDMNGPFTSFPASFDLDNIISVAAVDRHENKRTRSSFGLETVDLAAPSGDVWATYIDPLYLGIGGTSASTPQVAGVAALLRTLHPDWTNDQIKSRILSTVDLLPSLYGRTVTGGRLNALAALQPAVVPEPSISLAPAVIYEVLDNTFDDLGDQAIDVTTASLASVGEVDRSDLNKISRLIAKFDLPDTPPGTLVRATLRFAPVNIIGTPAGPVSVSHSQTDNDLDQLAADFEDLSYVDTSQDLLQPGDAINQYFTVDVTSQVLADYAADGLDLMSAFRLQIDEAVFFEDDNHHQYRLSMPNGTFPPFRPQLILTFIPEPTTLALAGLGLSLIAMRRKR